MSRTSPKWLFDEFAQVGIDYSKKEQAEEYDQRHETFRDFADEAQRIASSLGLNKNSVVLDIGCGTGGLSTHLADICRHVYAVDVSSAMIDVLKSKTERQKLKNITPIHSGFLTYQHEGPKLDGIIANINLHHLPDFWKQIVLCRFFDLLKPGGKLFLGDVVFDFAPREFHKELTSWLDTMEAAAGENMKEECIVHIREEFSTWDWIMTGMLERAGFTIEENTEYMPQMRVYICHKKEA
jgi:ubiquinone/menaquinone biosynthesis C-methylase UbiE